MPLGPRSAYVVSSSTRISRASLARGSCRAWSEARAHRSRGRRAGAQGARREEAHVIRARLEMRVEAPRAEREPEHRGGAVVRGRQQQCPARAQHAPQLRQPRCDVGDVFDDLAGPHDVDLVVGDRQRLAGGPQAGVEFRYPFRARRSASRATSTAIGVAPACASTALNSPAPQPTSSAVSPGRTPASRNARRGANRSGRASAGIAAQTASWISDGPGNLSRSSDRIDAVSVASYRSSRAQDDADDR